MKRCWWQKMTKTDANIFRYRHNLFRRQYDIGNIRHQNRFQGFRITYWFHIIMNDSN